MGNVYVTPPCDQTTMFELVDDLGLTFTWIGDSVPWIRFSQEGYPPEGVNEQGLPLFRGLDGPIDGGIRNGIPVLRYVDPRSLAPKADQKTDDPA